MNKTLLANLKNRKALYKSLKEEFIGPCVSEKSITLNSSKTVFFDKADDLYKSYKDQNTGEEILQQSPSRRYGTAVLYPLKTEKEDFIEEKEIDPNHSEPLIIGDASKDLESIDSRNTVDEDDADLDMVSANAYQQSSMAVSFKADFPHGSELVVHVNGGRYHPFSVKLKGGDEGKTHRWWVRVPVHFVVKIKAEKLLGSEEILEHGETTNVTNMEGLDIQANILSRPLKDTERLITVSLINRTQAFGHIPLDSSCLFQSSFKVEIIFPDFRPLILPYPEMADLDALDEEELSITLLYRKTKTYAVGHGCSADWSDVIDDKAAFVQTSFLPSYETKSMTPDITRDDGTDIVVSMRD